MQEASLMLVGLRQVVPTLPGVWCAATAVTSGCGGLSSQWQLHNNTLQLIAGGSGQTRSWRLGTRRWQDWANFEGKCRFAGGAEQPSIGTCYL
jgi:hypothetical protein